MAATKKQGKKGAKKAQPAKVKTKAKVKAKTEKKVAPKKAAAPKQKAPKAEKKVTTRRLNPKQLPADKMNEDERLVIKALTDAGRPLRNVEFIDLAFGGKGKDGTKDHKKAHSRVRNALRRLRETGWILPVGGLGEGCYRGHWMPGRAKKVDPAAKADDAATADAIEEAPAEETTSEEAAAPNTGNGVDHEAAESA